MKNLLLHTNSESTPKRGLLPVTTDPQVATTNMENLPAQPQPATSNIKNSPHNHNHNQTNPKPQPKQKTEAKTQPSSRLVHTKHPQPQLRRIKWLSVKRYQLRGRWWIDWLGAKRFFKGKKRVPTMEAE